MSNERPEGCGPPASMRHDAPVTLAAWPSNSSFCNPGSKAVSVDGGGVRRLTSA